MPHTLITADVHLQPDDQHPINQAFHQFLDTLAPKAEALYLLGDLFEMWVGDDVGIPQYQPIIDKLKRLTDAGLPIYLMYGNRDFLMRNAFWQATGIQWLQEPAKVNLHGCPALLMHGDALCTEDKAFQRARLLLRNPLVTWLFLKLPQQKRIRIGENMRAKSQKHNLNKAENIMDVSQSAVDALMARYPEVQDLIHGHTHRPALHQTERNGVIQNRWVLGDWRPQVQLLRIDKDAGFEWLTWPQHSDLSEK